MSQQILLSRKTPSQQRKYMKNTVPTSLHYSKNGNLDPQRLTTMLCGIHKYISDKIIIKEGKIHCATLLGINNSHSQLCQYYHRIYQSKICDLPNNKEKWIRYVCKARGSSSTYRNAYKWREKETVGRCG